MSNRHKCLGKRRNQREGKSCTFIECSFLGNMASSQKPLCFVSMARVYLNIIKYHSIIVHAGKWLRDCCYTCESIINQTRSEERKTETNFSDEYVAFGITKILFKYLPSDCYLRPKQFCLSTMRVLKIIIYIIKPMTNGSFCTVLLLNK